MSVAAGWVLMLALMGLPLMAAAPDFYRERRALVIQAVLDAMAAAHLTQKDAQNCMEMDKSHWSRSVAVEGDLHLSVFRLAMLPVRFQVEFVARYAFLVVRQSALEVAADVADARRSA